MAVVTHVSLSRAVHTGCWVDGVELSSRVTLYQYTASWMEHRFVAAILLIMQWYRFVIPLSPGTYAHRYRIRTPHSFTKVANSRTQPSPIAIHFNNLFLPMDWGWVYRLTLLVILYCQTNDFFRSQECKKWTDEYSFVADVTLIASKQNVEDRLSRLTKGGLTWSNKVPTHCWLCVLTDQLTPEQIHVIHHQSGHPGVRCTTYFIRRVCPLTEDSCQVVNTRL